MKLRVSTAGQQLFGWVRHSPTVLGGKRVEVSGVKSRIHPRHGRKGVTGGKKTEIWGKIAATVEAKRI